jgi:predicted permease
MSLTIDPPDGASLAPRDLRASLNLVSPGWFSALRIPVAAGRDFTAADRAGATRVAIVNEAYARRFGAGRSPIGRTLRSVAGGKPGPSVEIVGLVRDAVYGLPRDPVPPTVYYPLAQAGSGLGYVRLCVRAAGVSPASLARSVSAATLRVDPAARLTFQTLGDQLGATIVRERLLAMLAGFFGLLALLLAALGLYGVTAHAVNSRRAEIGIRMALGAAPAGVVRMVLGRVAALVTVGVVFGAGVSLWATRFVESMLFGLKARDPLTFVAAALVLAGIGLLAGWVPARRAARIDPATVLRES